MEVKTFKRQSDFNDYVANLKKDDFYKILEEQKGLFRTAVTVLLFNKKDIENYAIDKFHQILEILGIKDFKEETSLKERKIYIKLNCEQQNDFLLKKSGKLISSIQNLLVSYLMNKFGKWYEVTINVNNHLHNQKYFFKKQIYAAIKEIKQNNKPFHFKPMPNDQRKMIHEILKNIDGFASHSEGKGHFRHIVLEAKQKLEEENNSSLES